MSDKSGQFKKPEFYDGLVLYFHPYSYYSQKVRGVMQLFRIETVTNSLDIIATII